MCPNCNRSSLCGCNSCTTRRKGTMPRQRTHTYVQGGEMMKCPYCRVTSHPDAWLDQEMKNEKEKAL